MTELNQDDTIFQLLQNTTPTKVKKEEPHQVNNFSGVFETENFGFESDVPVEEKPIHAFLPVDWSLKSRLRLLCPTVIPGNNLKTNQESSGVTGFVRCIDDSSSTGLDISPGARFHQSTLYWQHPSIPWLTLFPRNSRANHGFHVKEAEAKALEKAWATSFRSLFQLVRSRQCPYFYVCANTFTVLFRAAGISGQAETHALITPTTRGMRAALKQEEIEFTTPLKPPSKNANKSPSTSFSNSAESLQLQAEEGEDEDDSDDDDDEKWLESLGVDANEIKRIHDNHRKKQVNAECEGDFTDQSLALVQGVDCQALFNFLLNSSKSTITKVGRLAYVPPTLLAPVAFQGATLHNLALKASKLRYDGQDYCSMELKGGPILPHVLPYLTNLLSETKDNFTATLTNVPNTIAFTHASEKLVITQKEVSPSKGDCVFVRENLSDCGLQPSIIDAMCRTGDNSVRVLEQVKFVRENEQQGYTF